MQIHEIKTLLEKLNHEYRRAWNRYEKIRLLARINELQADLKSKERKGTCNAPNIGGKS